MRRWTLRGMPGEEQYERAHWGDPPTRTTAINAPALKRAQRLVQLGLLRKFFLVTRRGEAIIETIRPYPRLCFGEKDGRLYLAGGSLAEMAQKHAFGPPGFTAWIRQTDYDAKKAGESVYWYHEHERPFARLVVDSRGFPHIKGGGYVVNPEGIVG